MSLLRTFPTDYVARTAPHETEFYYGLPVDILRPTPSCALAGGKPQVARFWFHSGTPGKVWIVVWDTYINEHSKIDLRVDRYPYPLLVYCGSLDISENAKEPPRMPAWAHELPLGLRFGNGRRNGRCPCAEPGQC
jgi:hypothetical protein